MGETFCLLWVWDHCESQLEKGIIAIHIIKNMILFLLFYLSNIRSI